MEKVDHRGDSTHVLLSALKNRKKQANISSNADVPYFSMEDVRCVLRERENEQREHENRVKIQRKQKLIEKVLVENKNTVVSTVGVADILGFDPLRRAESPKVENNLVNAKYKKYYVKLLQLRELLDNGANAIPEGIEFAWTMLRNEGDGKKEIQDAIDRIVNNTYGICEITGEKIAKERLEAVPFTRYSVAGQRIHEQQMAIKKGKQTGALFTDESEDVFARTYDEQEEE
ncbi:MAG: TraR/DksA C4-type zinc finger protein [Puniceicoccales bacterium]|jgi:RNA polymerase-binding transcription factor DksA|nr:TraR/DksA C4-type zinc finger protein [Puniceicoccales bacterium]